jgi:hypothetical protein
VAAGDSNKKKRVRRRRADCLPATLVPPHNRKILSKTKTFGDTPTFLDG